MASSLDAVMAVAGSVLLGMAVVGADSAPLPRLASGMRQMASE